MHWTLRTKILTGYAILPGVSLVILIRAIMSLLALGKANQAILRENYRSIQTAENMIDNIERQESSTLLVMLGYYEENLTQFRRNEVEFSRWPRQSTQRTPQSFSDPFYNAKHRIFGVVFLLQDVTELKELDHFKSEFVTIASHKLRTVPTGLAICAGLQTEEKR